MTRPIAHARAAESLKNEPLRCLLSEFDPPAYSGYMHDWVWEWFKKPNPSAIHLPNLSTLKSNCTTTAAHFPSNWDTGRVPLCYDADVMTMGEDRWVDRSCMECGKQDATSEMGARYCRNHRGWLCSECAKVHACFATDRPPEKAKPPD
jgi:hypothetical protein